MEEDIPANGKTSNFLEGPDRINPLTAQCVLFYNMSESETTSSSKWKVIRDGEAGRQGSRWERTFQFLVAKGLRGCSNGNLKKKVDSKGFHSRTIN